MIHHNRLKGISIHTPFTWVFDIESDRLTYTLEADEVPLSKQQYFLNRICIVNSSGAIYRLTSIQPLGWTVVGAAEVEMQQTLTDNIDNFVVIGDKLLDRLVKVDYYIETLAHDKFQVGAFKVLNIETGTADDQNETFSVPAEFDGNISISSDIDGNSIRMIINTNGIGQNLVVRYKLSILTKF